MNGYNARMRDAAVRVEAGISLRRAARMIGVSDTTLRIYEVDPLAVKSDAKRERIGAYYARLRAFVGAPVAEVA